jgi:hypothetical protein
MNMTDCGPEGPMNITDASLGLHAPNTCRLEGPLHLLLGSVSLPCPDLVCHMRSIPSKGRPGLCWGARFG